MSERAIAFRQRAPMSRIDEDDPEIVDVGLGRAAQDEVANGAEETRGVVVGQEIGGIEIGWAAQ